MQTALTQRPTAGGLRLGVLQRDSDCCILVLRTGDAAAQALPALRCEKEVALAKLRGRAAEVQQ